MVLTTKEVLVIVTDKFPFNGWLQFFNSFIICNIVYENKT